jgi:hypothetical protein
MSTHILDVSGQRALTATMNDPAATRANVPAKAGDDVALSVGGCRETRISLPANAKVQRRRYVTRSQKKENGKIVRDEAGEIVYDEKPYEQLYLVIPGGGITAFCRSSNIEPPAEDELHFSESGELVEEIEFAELLSTH